MTLIHFFKVFPKAIDGPISPSPLYSSNIQDSVCTQVRDGPRKQQNYKAFAVLLILIAVVFATFFFRFD